MLQPSCPTVSSSRNVNGFKGLGVMEDQDKQATYQVLRF